MDEGIYVWLQDDGIWPPRVRCVIMARNRYDAEEKAEDFASQHGVPAPDYADVVEVYEHDLVEGVFKT